MKRNRRLDFVLLIILAVLILLASVVILCLPLFNRFSQEKHSSEIVAEFRGERESAWAEQASLSLPLPTTATSGEASAEPETQQIPFAALRAAMEEYNRQIYSNNQIGLEDPWCYTASMFDLDAYGLTTEAVGILSIPRMDFEEPVFLGATMDHLDLGTAQLSISSMPIGGINTNCVLAGHRGWNGALHFRHIELLEPGDEIILTNLWEELHYTVSEIKIIHPNQTEELLIQEGRDLLTLLTCHPYGSGGKYRYVVYCERKEE